ncbi:MAG: excinuclease ABC subunit UvrC [Oscillospiraceae bacterium]|jgi:excinuclease ABC subunit C|nr:excinuclease ABC subunit UvrC [Oscillospiraceae bacterium]
MNKKIENLRILAKKVPASPGVYIMKNKNEEIIYIGKAKILPNRLLQYFQNTNLNSLKTHTMVNHIENFEYIITSNEYEALILECNLIKIHCPKYNILLKDSKGYHYIEATKENWRRLRLVSKKTKNASEYFGPYISYFDTKKLFEKSCEIFKIAVCKKNLDIRSKPCLNFYINRCSAPCDDKISIKEYDNNFKNALKFIKNGDLSILKDLKKEMLNFASQTQYEKAAKIRDTIFAIERMRSKQNVILSKVKEQDVIAFFVQEPKAAVEVFKFHNGSLYEAENFIVKYSQDLPELRSEFIKTYYNHRNFAPLRIALDDKPEDQKLIERWLCEKFNKKIKILIPKKGNQCEIIRLCRQNAKNLLVTDGNFADLTDEISNEKILKNLAQILNLARVPKYIESYDISNTNGVNNVGSMVVFKDGIPFKNAYRKFKIRIDSKDDYASMSEMLTRRIRWYEFSDKTDFLQNKNFNDNIKMPDLILIDGGMTHVKIISEVLKQHKFEVPIFGMVKDSKHRTRALVSSKKNIEIQNNTEIFKFITKIQDETHRFAITYHKNLRGRKMLSS